MFLKNIKITFFAIIFFAFFSNNAFASTVISYNPGVNFCNTSSETVYYHIWTYNYGSRVLAPTPLESKACVDIVNAQNLYGTYLFFNAFLVQNPPMYDFFSLENLPYDQVFGGDNFSTPAGTFHVSKSYEYGYDFLAGRPGFDKDPVVVNGSCGTEKYSCSTGSSVNNVGDTWDCVGSNGGSNASCTYIAPQAGICGNEKYTCASGYVTNNINLDNTWTCAGIGGQSGVNCKYDVFNNTVITLQIATTSTSTAMYPSSEQYECGITSGSEVLGCIKSAFAWAFFPDKEIFNDYIGLVEKLKYKAPIGYLTSFIGIFKDLSNTSSTNIVLALVPIESSVYTLFFQPLRNVLLIVVIFFGVVWLFRRFKDTQI